jgi:hypothetical protein
VNEGAPLIETVTVLLFPQIVARPAALVVPPVHAPEISKSMRNCPAVPFTVTGDANVLWLKAIELRESMATVTTTRRRRIFPHLKFQNWPGDSQEAYRHAS